jgi:hypothetical protein
MTLGELITLNFLRLCTKDIPLCTNTTQGGLYFGSIRRRVIWKRVIMKQCIENAEARNGRIAPWDSTNLEVGGSVIYPMPSKAVMVTLPMNE